MRRKRSGLTPVEVLLILAVIVLLALGGFLWMRVSKLNTWAVATDAWLVNDLYPWIRNNNFQVGPEGAGVPDGNKPPDPPDGL